LIFLTLSAMSVSIYRQLYPGKYGDVDFAFFELSKIVTFITEFFSKMDGDDGKLIAAISCIIITIFIIIGSTLSLFPSIIEKEKKKKGYTDHLIGLVISIGIIYGIMLAIWIAMIIKYTQR